MAPPLMKAKLTPHKPSTNLPRYATMRPTMLVTTMLRKRSDTVMKLPLYSASSPPAVPKVNNTADMAMPGYRSSKKSEVAPRKKPLTAAYKGADHFAQFGLNVVASASTNAAIPVPCSNIGQLGAACVTLETISCETAPNCMTASQSMVPTTDSSMPHLQCSTTFFTADTSSPGDVTLQVAISATCNADSAPELSASRSR